MSEANGDVIHFRHGNTCPVCGGCEEEPRGNGTRCFGFISGEWVHCTRPDFSSGCDFHTGSDTFSHRLKGKCRCGVEHNPADPSDAQKTLECVYQYRDAACKVVHETVRYRLANGDKTFKQRRPDGNGGYIWKDVFKDIIPVLYNLPAILAADPNEPIWIVEGEKDVDRLGTLNRLATCNPMGALKWRDHYSDVLKGRTCYIIPDNDPPEAKYPDGKGLEHAQQVAQSLHGKAASIKVVELPGLPEKGDVSDFLSAGGTVLQLDELAQKAAEWEGREQP